MTIYSKACFEYVMNQRGFSLCFKAWVYAYQYVLTNSIMCDKFVSGKLHFIDFAMFPDERYYWKPDPLPDELLVTDSEYVEFWGAVKHWCEEVLFSRYYDIVHGGPNTGGGVGLTAKFNCNASVVTSTIVGLLQACTLGQSRIMQNVHKLQTLYRLKENSKKELVHVLYGPTSLLNNDNSSELSFIDLSYVSCRKLYWEVPILRIIRDRDPWEAMVAKDFRGVQLHVAKTTLYFRQGHHILVNYQDPNFVDLTGDDEEGGTDCVQEECDVINAASAQATPARKRARCSDTPYNSVLASAPRTPVSASSTISFDFGSSQSSSGSSGSSSGSFASTSSSSCSTCSSMVV